MAVGVHAADRGAVAALAQANLTMANDVLPMLRRAIPDIVLPDRVMLDSTIGEGGVVRHTVEDGAVVAIRAPVVGVGSTASMQHAMFHEICHFHELSLRKAFGLVFDSHAASGLWSEYFAERHTWAAGLTQQVMDAGTNADAAPPANSPAEGTTRVPYSSTGYMLAFVQAHVDADPACRVRYDDKLGPMIDTLFPQSGVRDLFDRFPRWDASDTIRCSTWFAFVNDLDW